ncbi:MAG: secondary thiamine-phosphate synthase enzyme YjbQ [Ignavibacteriaceae bacterium]|nr:secondary thiamine-phosphate synthase enzyme YjbQ [Ignavibacteriaceae bacterium]
MIDLETHSFDIKTSGNCHLTDITAKVQDVINSCGFVEGNVIVFAVGSTAGITTIEYEPGLMKDYPAFFEKIIPSNVSYHHDQTWHDGNGHSHLRSALQGTSLSVPFKDGDLLLGTWQQIIFVDFDNRSRSRKIIVQIIGKKSE